MSVKLIKDPIWGNIPFSRLEDKVLSHPLFNRLHNVIQNSMAYRVYPSDKTSRFSHSVGVMHVATEIFNFSLANSKPDWVLEFFDSLEKSIFPPDVKESPYSFLQYQIKHFQTQTEKGFNFSKFRQTLVKAAGDQFSRQVFIPPEEISKDDRLFCIYSIVLMGLRLKSLLHDIGHLPYSHLLEFALHRIKNRLEAIANIQPPFSQALETLKKFESGGAKQEIHEEIGGYLSGHILTEIGNLPKDPTTLTEEEIGNTLIWDILRNSLQKFSSSGDFFAIYEIFSSELDADRFDFVARDGFFSGLMETTGDIGRIIRMFALTKLEGHFKFLPAIQSLNDVQEVLLDRLRIYKYLVSHHKVKKLDYLVEKSIEAIYLCQNTSDQTQQAELEKKYFSDLFSVIDTAFLPFDSSRAKRLSYEFLQFTDGWLFSILNSSYVRLVENDTTVQKWPKLLRQALNEIFTGAKYFDTLWKRDFEFNKFAKDFGKKVTSNKAKKLLEKALIKFPKDKFKDNPTLKGLEIFSALKKLDNWWNDLENEFASNGKNVLIAIPKIKAGVKDLRLVNLNNLHESELFRDCSEMFNYIHNEVKRSIAFYCFYDKSCFDSPDSVKEAISSFLLRRIEKLLKEENENEKHKE